MSEGIRTVAVLGAGVMGSAIAAHLAGAGLNVHLLDIVPRDAGNQRNLLAENGIRRALKEKPAPFFDPDAARLIQPGNLEDHLERLREADLVIEAVVELMKVKQALFRNIAGYLKDDAVLASNTSGLSIAEMEQTLPEGLRPRFLVLHFFNPVRYMHLLEIVAAPSTDARVVERMARFGEFLGKGIVFGKDTTNFVANRIGVFGLMFTMHEMLRQGLGVEQVDAIVGKPMARPKSAAFNTADIVGIDTLIHVAKNCYDSLPDDPDREVFQMPEFVTELASAGRLGRKSGAGFYKKVGKDILVYDLSTKDYRPRADVAFASLAALRDQKGQGARLKTLVEADDAAGRFAWALLAKTLLYSARLVGEIADDIVNVDRAMRWGFNWELGPFEAWDAIGVAASVERMKAGGAVVPAWIDEMLASGRDSFYGGDAAEPDFYHFAAHATRPVPLHPRHLRVAALRARGKIVEENRGASLLDLEDGVLCLELHTKMNTLDGDVIAMIDRAVEVAEQSFSALVVGNDSDHFSAGANLMMIVGAAQAGKWGEVDRIIATLQNSLQRLRYARVPVVTAPCQYTLGGGAELAMAGDAAQAFAETYMGLVEAGVGLIPAGCGCLRLVERFTAETLTIEGTDPLPLIAEASLNVAMAKVSTSAEEARRLRYLRPTDGISLNRDFLLYQAKQRALGLAGAGYQRPRPLQLKAAGHDAAKTIGARIWSMVEGGFASPHDAVIANHLAHILCGGVVAEGSVLDEQHYLDLEREAFLALCGEKKTQERIEHMLKTGKPLRN